MSGAVGMAELVDVNTRALYPLPFTSSVTLFDHVRVKVSVPLAVIASQSGIDK